MSTAGMTVRWSWRDLRKRWRLVVALAVAIAIGTGIFAALQSMTKWRTESNDRSFEALAMHELKVRLGDGLFADRGALLDILASIPDAGLVGAAEERLVVPVQIDASTAAQTILVSGELVGMSQAPAVDKVHVFAGAGLDQGEALLALNFARFHELPDEGTVIVGGGGPLHYGGVGTAPEYLYITGGERGGLFAHASYAVLFVPIDQVGELTGRRGAVNDLVLTLQPGADRQSVQQQLETALATAIPGLDPRVTTRDDDPVYSTLYEDIGNDQQVYTIVAVLVLVGAAIATFNLITRIVEAQRREIGIGMALGATPRLLAARPLLVGVQIALLGALLGIGLGYLAMAALAGILADIVPLPIWVTDLEARAFLVAAIPGVLIPVVAAAL
ncbi:MAG: FtsX-like permease family protein, partial [Actinobacteria bacterium]